MCSIALARTARGLPAVGAVHAVEAQPPSFFCHAVGAVHAVMARAVRDMFDRVSE